MADPSFALADCGRLPAIFIITQLSPVRQRFHGHIRAVVALQGDEIIRMGAAPGPHLLHGHGLAAHLAKPQEAFGVRVFKDLYQLALVNDPYLHLLAAINDLGGKNGLCRIGKHGNKPRASLIRSGHNHIIQLRAHMNGAVIAYILSPKHNANKVGRVLHRCLRMTLTLMLPLN